MRKTETMPSQPFAENINAEAQQQAQPSEVQTSVALNQEHEKIAKWLKKVRFRKKIFGGVNEQEVWKKIDELNKMYEDALKAERVRYDVLLAQQRQTHNSDRQPGDPTKEI